MPCKWNKEELIIKSLNWNKVMTGLVIQNVWKKTDGLQLSPIDVNENYRKEWSAYCNDFVCLTVNGELLRETLYRVGGLNTPNLGIDKYFMLIKHVEGFYSDEILKMAKSDNPKHLESRWCILDSMGNEKIEFSQFKHPYLLKDSCIYSIDNSYYNIETGECYGRSYHSMTSKDFLFIDNTYEKDKSKCGIMKISKIDGTWEIFS